MQRPDAACLLTAISCDAENASLPEYAETEMAISVPVAEKLLTVTAPRKAGCRVFVRNPAAC